MNGNQMKEFTSKMLDRKVFTCASCNGLLNLPVMLVKNIGNVCNTCFENNENFKESLAIPNTQLDAIIKELELPCKFKPEGCQYFDYYEDLKQHEEECEYRFINCLFSKTECDWTGKLKELLKHFTEHHSEHILKSPDNKISFEMSTESPIKVVKLLSNNGKNLMLRIWENEQQDELIHLIQEIKPDVKEKHVDIKYIGKNSIEYKFRVECHPFTTTYLERNGRKVSISMIQEIANVLNKNVNLLIKLGAQNIENKAMMRELECSVCKELMRSPISLCYSGHSICSSCKSRVANCPTCRKKWSNARNYTLESFAAEIKYPCAYNKFGCEATVLGKNLNEHESICEYKTMFCPICSEFEGSESSFNDHVASIHKNDVVEGLVYHHTFKLTSVHFATSKFFCDHGNIYILIFFHKTNAKSYHWYVFKTKNYNSNFKDYYKVTITDHQRKFSSSTLCLDPFGDDPENPKNTITLFESLLNTFKTQDNSISFYLEIFRTKETSRSDTRPGSSVSVQI